MVEAVRARITSKGQVTLPKAVRDALGLEQGSVVEFDVRDGEAVMRPAGTGFLARYGSVASRQQPEDWTQVRSKARKMVSSRRGEKRR
jgi:AbrB family looped-hinge helix DNA binding protein